VLYLKVGLHKNEIKRMLTALYANKAITTAHDLLRVNESEYKESQLDASSDDESVINALVKFPKLLERPVFINNDVAAIGRPLDNIANILLKN
jgi:arsenate reductase